MIATLADIKKEFKVWNKKAFKNELPEPSFELMNTKRLLGQFCPRMIGDNCYGYKIRISTFYDRPYNDFIDTLVHEMLHYYIRYKDINDTSSHGRVWKSMAADLNKKFGLNIKRTGSCGKISEDILEKKAKGKTKYEYAFICKLKDGRYGAAVLPVNKLTYYTNRLRQSKVIESMRIVSAPWNETYPLKHLRSSATIKIISRDRYEELSQHKDIKV